MEYAVDPLNEYQTQMLSYWDLIRVEIENLKCDNAAFKTQDLPLARIKKIMKLDDDIKSMMISAEAPILFAKAAELFIRELTLRAWIHTERNRRRTLQRNDIAMSVSDGDTDQFDFLIDIVPREETRAHRRASHTGFTNNAAPHGSVDPSQQQQQQHQHHLKTENLVTFATAGTGNAAVSGSTLQLISTTPSTSVAGVGEDMAAATSTAASSVATAATGIQFVSAGNPQTSTTALVVAGGGGAAGGGASAAAGQIQYVLQLPSSMTGGQLAGAAANSVGAGQPFHIQLLPQHFQASSTDVMAASSAAGSSGVVGGPATATTMLTDVNGNTIPLVQVVSQAAGGGLTLPIVHDASGGRAQILQLQMPETATGETHAATLLLPQHHHHHVAYALQQQQQPHVLATATLADLQHKEQQVYHLSFAPSNNDPESSAGAGATTAIVLVNDENAQATGMDLLEPHHQQQSTTVVELSDSSGEADLLQSNGNSSPDASAMMGGVEILTIEPPSSTSAVYTNHCIREATDDGYAPADTNDKDGDSAADQ